MECIKHPGLISPVSSLDSKPFLIENEISDADKEDSGTTAHSRESRRSKTVESVRSVSKTYTSSRISGPSNLQLVHRLSQVTDQFDKAQGHLESLGKLCSDSKIMIKKSQEKQEDLVTKFQQLAEQAKLLLDGSESDDEKEINR